MVKKHTRALEKAIILFNSGKVKETIEYLKKIEVITELDDASFNSHESILNEYQASEFARFLYEGVGLNKNTIGDFLGDTKPLQMKVNFLFFECFTFYNMVLDVALRSIFKKLRLPKEFN